MRTLDSLEAATWMGCFGGLYFLAFSKISRTSETNAAASWYFIASRVSATVLPLHQSLQSSAKTLVITTYIRRRIFRAATTVVQTLDNIDTVNISGKKDNFKRKNLTRVPCQKRKKDPQLVTMSNTFKRHNHGASPSTAHECTINR